MHPPAAVCGALVYLAPVDCTYTTDTDRCPLPDYAPRTLQPSNVCPCKSLPACDDTCHTCADNYRRNDRTRTYPQESPPHTDITSSAHTPPLTELRESNPPHQHSDNTHGQRNQEGKPICVFERRSIVVSSMMKATRASLAFSAHAQVLL